MFSHSKLFLISILFFLSVFNGIAQYNSQWFYITAREDSFSPNFNYENGVLSYQGDLEALSEILQKYAVFEFKKTQKHTSKETVNRTFFVRTNDSQLLDDLLKKLPTIFESGMLISEAEKKIFEPNDYGLTATIGDAKGFAVNLDYYDFLGLPKAWYYTTGSKDIILGISDGRIDPEDPEFKGKTKVFRDPPFSKGHGVSQAATAAAQGDNGYGFPGLCYDCSLYNTTYGSFKGYDQLLEITQEGAKVINCSWIGRYSPKEQQMVDSIFKLGTIIVASGGNLDWIKSNKGKLKYYPASYDKVIAVSSVMYKYEKPEDNILYEENHNPYVSNIRGYIGRTAGFKDHKVENGIALIYPQGIATLNDEIDILAPTVGIFSYGYYVINDQKIHYNEYETTSGASPFVTGTLGLMFSLYPCLPVDQVESILKMTSLNIDHLEVNKPYKGMYGSGILQTGDAVEMVYQLYNENETAYIRNQNFSRWDFKITSHSKEIVIQNQKFTENATLQLTAKNKIVLKENTVLKPGPKGKIALKINPNLQKECDLILRDPSILNE